MGRFYKASSGRILLIENDEKLTQEEVDLADELQQIAFPDEGKIKILMIKKRTRLDLVYAMGDKFK